MASLMSYKPLSLEGRVAVVIGGTTGIGRAIVEGLAQAGADVVASSRRSEEVDATAAFIEGAGRRTLRVTSDVTDRASLQRLADETHKAFDKVDILVNCAGRTKRTRTAPSSRSSTSWRRASVKPRTASFDAAYMPCSGSAARGMSLPTFTSTPPCPRRCGIATSDLGRWERIPGRPSRPPQERPAPSRERDRTHEKLLS